MAAIRSGGDVTLIVSIIRPHHFPTRTLLAASMATAGSVAAHQSSSVNGRFGPEAVIMP